MWTWGLNDRGQLGHDRDDVEVGLPGEVPLPERCTALAAGYFHTLAIGESGALWAWGCNGKGQLGLGKDAVLVREPRLVKALQGARTQGGQEAHASLPQPAVPLPAVPPPTLPRLRQQPPDLSACRRRCPSLRQARAWWRWPRAWSTRWR